MKKNKNSLVPRLRFKEFENDGEWEETAIESIGNVITGSTPSKKQNDYWDGDFVWTTAQDFSKKYIYDSVLKLSKKGKAKTRVIPKNSVLVTCIASIGLNAINKVECATNQQINSIVCNSSFYYEFVYYVIEANINRLKNLAGQTAVPIINKSSFEKFVVLTPNITEQQKIANTLSSLDSLIESEQSKLEQLQEHKKGLMQNLFPQEGETMPKFRFKEFENDGEWEEKQLGKIASIVNAKVGDKDVTLFSIDADKGLVTQIEKFGRIIAGKSIPNYYFIQKGDFAYNKSATKAYPQGQISILETHEEGAVPNSIFTCFRFKDLILPNYAKYLFMNNMHGKWIADYIEVGARAHGALAINNKILLQLPIPFPVNPKEQQKIAETLSSLDQLISAQTERIELLQEHKKGLMQGMFPVMEHG